jgi:hypothetical protein
MPNGNLTLYASGYSLLEKIRLIQSEQRRQETLDSSGRPKVERFFTEDTYSVLAPRTSTPSIGFPSGFIPDFSSGATEFADPTQVSAGGPDLILDRGYGDEPNRLAGRSTSSDIALLFTEDNFLQSSFSGNLGSYTIGKYLQLSRETPTPSPVDIKDVNNPAWKILNVSDRRDNIHVRLDWETSSNCGGSNNRVQSATLTIVTNWVINRLINFEIDGRAEAQNTGFEALMLSINNKLIFSSQSEGFEDGCKSAIPVIYTFFGARPSGKGLAKFSALTGPEQLTFIRFNLSTVDTLFHVDAYYDLKINFT